MDDFDTQQRQLEQRRLMAMQLRNTEIPQGRMMGRLYVKQPGETIAAALRQYQGQQELDDVNKQATDLGQRRQQMEQADMQAFAQALRGTPEMTNAPATPMDDEGNVMPTTVTPAQKGDPYAAYSGLAASQSQNLRQAGLQGLSQFPQMEARQAEREADRQSRMQMQQQQIEARKDMQAQASADRRALAGIAAGNRQPEAPVAVIGPDGKPMYVSRTEAYGKQPYSAGESKGSAVGGQKVSDANDVLTLLSEADKILPSATGSYGGKAIDEAFRVVGKSTPGAQAGAKLKAIQGALVSKMPKMSGPQSDKDVLLYREMAGQIGDDTLPIETRKAAMDTIRTLNEKYAGVTPATSVPNQQDEAAFQWAASNPNDPRAAAIRKRLGR